MPLPGSAVKAKGEPRNAKVDPSEQRRREARSEAVNPSGLVSEAQAFGLREGGTRRLHYGRLLGAVHRLEYDSARRGPPSITPAGLWHRALGPMQSNEQLLRNEAVVPPQPFDRTTMNRLEGRPVVRSPEQLCLHRALKEIGWTGVIDEFNGAALPENQSVPEPIVIMRDGTILAGFGKWRLALFEGRQEELHCIEYPLTEEESLGNI